MIDMEWEPGRLLDEMVAETVMGWKRQDPRRGLHPWKVPDGRTAFMPDTFSTNLRAAWDVVDKLTEDVGGVTIEYSDGNGNGKSATVRIVGWLDNEMQQIATASGDSLPVAVCRVALRAVARLGI